MSLPDTVTRAQQAVAKLGPERSRMALAAFDDRVAGWHWCALARAYGEPGALWVDASGLAGGLTMRHGAAALLGLTIDEVNAVVELFDDPASRGALRLMFQAEAAKLKTQPEEPAWEDAPSHEGELVYVTA